jgi:hypothetical protein
LRIEFGDETKLVVEHGDWALVVLSVHRDTNELRSKLRKIVREFEDSFPNLRGSDETIGSSFQEFDQFVRRVFTMNRLNEKTIIVKDPNWTEHDQPYEAKSSLFKLSRLMLLVDTGQTISEVSRKQKIPLNETMDLVSRAYWSKWVHLNFIPSETDILKITEGSLRYLMQRENPSGISRRALKLIASLDGRTPLLNYLHNLDKGEMVQVLVDLGDLLSKGYLSRISIERRLVFVNECVLNKLILDSRSIIGKARVTELFNEAIESAIITHPWISRVSLSDDLIAKTRMPDRIETQDLNDIYEALSSVIHHLTQSLSKKTQYEYLGVVVKTAKKSCHERWAPYLSDVIT